MLLARRIWWRDLLLTLVFRVAIDFGDETSGVECANPQVARVNRGCDGFRVIMSRAGCRSSGVQRKGFGERVGF